MRCSHLKNKIIIVGGGASGLMAASFASNAESEVIIIEKNTFPGKKILITGKGRCNVTNDCDNETFIKNMTKNPKFMYSAINSFSSDDTKRFFEDRGVKLKTERGNRVFPVSDKASDIRDALYDYVKSRNVKLINARVKAVLTDKENGAVSGVLLDSGEKYECSRVIIATGGYSYPATGSTGDGQRIAKALGHTVTRIIPSLVPLETFEDYSDTLAGLSLKNISIKVIDKNKNKTVYEDFGEMLFMHHGLSGPVILSASAHMRDENAEYMISIDMKPALDIKTLDQRIRRDLEINSNKDLINSLDALLPRSMIPVVIQRSEIFEHKKSNLITKDERKRLLENIKDFKADIKGFAPIEQAIVTSGGVNVREVDPKTMESRLIKGLYFAGEVLDLDAYTGGFNLQIAFSTGKLAGENAGKEI